MWREWVIVNNTFEGMLLSNGDMCPGENPRQTKVLYVQITETATTGIISSLGSVRGLGNKMHT